MALNLMTIMGRITKDLEMRQVNGGNAAVNFTVAVDRNYKNKDGSTTTDFVPCQAYGKTAEFICKYFGKGRMINCVGSFRSNPYTDKNGESRTIYCMQVETANFTGEPKKEETQSASTGGNSSENPSEYPSIGDFNSFEDFGNFEEDDVF